ncbi:MAG: helix-turn-helix domain-containing protein [Chlamydiae bacterium]|nr:helix-turn-helix domain-containing protein [Chlamydiota bacterium]
MAVVSRRTDPVLPKTRDIALAEDALSHMSKFMSQVGSKDIHFALQGLRGKEVIEFSLTPPVVELIFRTIVHIAKGDAVTIVPFHAELTTQEAANFLNVSRPYLIGLLEGGKIPFRKVGRHRRVLFEELVKYKELSKEKSRKMHEKLTDESQDLGMGY